LGKRKLKIHSSVDVVFKQHLVSVCMLVMCCVFCACSRETGTSADAAHSLEKSAAATTGVPGEVSQSVKADRPIGSGGEPFLNSTPANVPDRQQTAAPPEKLLEELLWFTSSPDVEFGRQVEIVLNQLGQAGYEGMWAIKEFLLTNLQSPNLGEFAVREQALRQSLLGLLLDSDLPGVEGLALELLTNQPEPWEVAQLGLYLEANHPGQFTYSIRHVAEQALIGTDSYGDIPGQLFQLLGEVGDSSTISLLANIPMHQDAYASVALALLPDGSGIALLEQDARLFEIGQYTTHGRLAIELLAQQAHQYTDASNVLIDLARKNLIPSDIWPQVVSLLAGNQQLTLVPPAGGRISRNTIYRQQGNQTIYLTSRPREHETSEQINQRLYVLGQLQQLAPEAFMNQFISAQDQLNRLKQSLSALSAISKPINACHVFFIVGLHLKKGRTT
jgi:hypothetical protein